VVLAEHQTPLPGEGPASHSDALCLAKGAEGLVTVIVEGKESESFDEPVAKWLASGGENRRVRLRGVCGHLGLDPDRVSDIEWQLLHRTAAAVIEADNYGARQTVMLVHSFSSVRHGLGAYGEFVACFGADETEANSVIELAQRGSTSLYVAWVADQPRAAVDGGSAEDVFLSALDWLRSNYRAQQIFNERDVERALQSRMTWLIAERRLPLRVFHAYPMERGPRRSLAVDLAVLDDQGAVALGIELKYEPANEREGRDIWTGKLPVTEWRAIKRDFERLRRWVDDGRAALGYTVLVDEGSRYRARLPVDEVQEWERRRTGYETTVHLRRVAAEDAQAGADGP
jgi:hypothetical protein